MDAQCEEGFDALRKMYYATVDLVLVLYSVADKDSLDSIESRWWPEINQHCQNMPILLVGTKSDLTEHHVTLEMATEVCSKLGGKGVFECSALENTGVKEVFDAASTLLATGPSPTRIGSEEKHSHKCEVC